jgi:hypothetical protein
MDQGTSQPGSSISPLMSALTKEGRKANKNSFKRHKANKKQSKGT